MTAQLTSGFVQKPVFREKFPVKRPLSGNYSRRPGITVGDRFASDCAHHHPVFANRTFPIRRRIGRFRGEFRPLTCGTLVSARAHVFLRGFLAPCLCIPKGRSRRPGLGREVSHLRASKSYAFCNSGRWAGPALRLFRIESERLKLPAPFCRRIAKPLDADAAGQATFYSCLDKIRCEEGE